ncbi:MAG TPA: response regulator [Anaeromyxobacteraceae bacterium]|nr:response regulator [Anaeromyxobacteraceae bacterium]
MARYRFLIAEDDPGTSRLYQSYALRRGHEVLLARDGAETLLLAAAERPDVILLDVAMPKLDGRDVLKQLKASPRTAKIPVMVVTAMAGDQLARGQLVDLGADDVVEKPIDLHGTFAKAERLAERAREG